MGFKVAKSFKFESLKEQGLKLILRFGFVIWLWAFLFARVPMAAIQDLFGLESRPLLLLDCLSVGFALVGFSQVGWRPWKVFQVPIVRTAGLSFCFFWIFYLLRLLFDQWVFSVELVTPAITLIKHLLTSTLIPALCLPWVVAMASWGSTLFLLVGLGSISLFFGELSFLFMNGFEALMKVRFGFEDLSPIPAAYSSASLVIISSLLIWFFFDCQTSRNSRIFQLLFGLIGLLLGLFGMQLAMTKGAFLALIPLVVYLGWCLSGRFRAFGFLAVLGVSATAAISMFGSMRRAFWSQGSIQERVELLRQSLEVWSDHSFVGVGFRAQGILEANPFTISNHWYPHNFVVETLLLGGAVLMALLASFIVSILLSASFCASFVRFKDELQVPLTLLWIQGLASALVSGHLALIPGMWVGGLLVVMNRYL